MNTRNQFVVKMYKWQGLKYGGSVGLFVGLITCFFEPELFGQIYITMPIMMAGCAIVVSVLGFLFFPLLKSSFVSTEGEPSDQEIMDFYSEKGSFWRGTAETSVGGSDYGSGDGGSGSD
jgi:hypothetical protein